MGKEILLEGFPYGIQLEGDTMTKDEKVRIDQLILKLPELQKLTEPVGLFGFEVPETTEQFVKKELEKVKKIEAKKLLQASGFYPPDEKLSPMEKYFHFDRDAPVITGSLFGSWPGMKKWWNLKNIKYVDPKKFAFAGGQAFFGGTFGQIVGAQAYDMANYILSGGDEDFKPTWAQLSQDTKDAMFWESVGLILPEAIPALFRKAVDLKNPAIKKLTEAADRLGIDLDLRFITKYGKLGGSLGPLPLLGGVVRKGTEVITDQLNTYYNALLSKVAPVSRFTDMGHNLYAAAKGIKNQTKETMGDLWNDVYKLHALLPDKNIFNAKALKEAVDGVISGNTFRGKQGGFQLPRDQNGIVLGYDDLVAQGWFTANKLSRLETRAGKDFFNLLREMQETIQKQGGEISYADVTKYRDMLNDMYKGFMSPQGSQEAQNLMNVVLTQLRHGTDDVIDVLNINKDKLKGLPEGAADILMKAHDDAMTFTKNALKLWEGDAANIFGKYTKNMFKGGYEVEKKTADQIFEGFMKLKSPDQLKQVRKLIGKENYSKLIDEYFSNAFNNSLSGATTSKKGELIFDIIELGRNLGYDNRMKGEFWDEIFKHSSVPRRLIEDIMEVGGAVKGLKIGDPSTFLQRRIALTGWRSVLGKIANFMPVLRSGTTAGAGLAGAYGAFGPVGSLIAVLGMRYGFGKLFSNPQLAKNVIKFDNILERQLGLEQGKGIKLPETIFGIPIMPKKWSQLPKMSWRTQFGLLRDLFNVHINELPPEEREAEAGGAFQIFNDLYNSVIDWNSSLEDDDGRIPKETLDYLRDLRNEFPNPVSNPATKGDIEIETEGVYDTGADQVIEDQTSFIDVPRPDPNVDMAQVVSPLPSPVPSGASAQLDPDVVARLESVGLPLFGNQGGIASLLNPSQPRQMVA